MIIDSRSEFSSAQSLSASAASNNVIDLGPVDVVGPGTPLWVVVQVLADLAGTTPTFQAAIQTDDNQAFSSPRDIATLEQLTTAPAGTRQVIGMPYTNERFLRLYYTLGGTGPSITVAAWLTDQDPRQWTSFAAAI